jgi:protein PhnA
MSLERDLQKRSDNKCELCASEENLSVYGVQPKPEGTEKDSVYICLTCSSQIDKNDEADPNHWRCLNDSMWSEVDAVKVLAWRMLSRLKSEGWTQDLLDMLYIEDDTLEWAKATGEGVAEEDQVIHRDVNGVILNTGDSVVLIKDLKVKGGGFTAKRGTAVRRISLDLENPTYIEGKVEGQTVVLITEYVKKL